MIKQVRFNKKQRVVDELVHRIESGLLADGHLLPEADQLAQELRVSHSTLRAALAELEKRKYIAKRTEGGAIVTYDGITLDQNNGWTQALANTGARIHTELLRLEAIERADLLHRFGVDLAADRKPGQVSGGQAQRIALCRALLGNPDIILADEPTGNLDPSTAAVVVSALKEQATAGATVVIVTHSPDVAAACDREIVL